MKINYQLVLDDILKEIKKSHKTPKLLLHSCCAPCSSYVLEYLSNYLDITIFYHNPNIDSKMEFIKRADEQQRLIKELKKPVKFILKEYVHQEFLDIIKGLEKEKEGGSRCCNCFYLRMREAAKFAKENGYDYFTTTLSISPYKNSQILNKIGEDISKELNIQYLYADFKKRNGYKRSIELSKEYNLYRQEYCGCEYSKIQ